MQRQSLPLCTNGKNVKVYRKESTKFIPHLLSILVDNFAKEINNK